MKSLRIIKQCIFILLVMSLATCTPSNEDFFQENMQDDMINGTSSNDGTSQNFDPTITVWDGEKADDADEDIVGTNADFYHEANSFTSTVTITYNETSASIETSNSMIKYYVAGAYVTIDMQTNSVSNVEIIIKGKSDDGGLKIYGEKKFKLTMNGVELTSNKGPAINSQCKKRIFVHLQEGTTNQLTDATTYTDDNHYLDASADEDRKGCFFSEGNLVLSGTGTLIVAGKYKHGIATDGYFWIRPGVTIAITEAAKNGIQAKGDNDDNIGVYVKGGLIYTNISSDAGKGIKTDLNAEIAGGKLMLNTSGDAIYESEENDTSSSAGIKSDGSIIISGGIHTLKSIGTGGKGLNANADIIISGGETTITTTGSKYTYSSSLTSSPKGAKADCDVTICGGKLNISVTGKSDGSEGLESKAAMTISSGEVYVYAYDDGINAAQTFNVTGGKVYAYSGNNDGIDSNGTMLISGGLVIASGAGSPEGGIDVDNSNNFKINGGIILACGGSLQSNPSSNSTQRSVAYNGMSISKGQKVAVLNSSYKPILTFEFPRTMSNSSFFFSCPDIKANNSYTISSDGILSGYTDNWNSWYDGGSWSGGTQLTSFTSSSVITTIGSSNGGGPGGGGRPGEW